MLLLHPTAQLGWTSFPVHESTVIGLLALGGAYFWRAERGPSLLDEQKLVANERVAKGERTPSPAQRTMFLSGLAIIFLTLNGPLHDLSDYFLFSAHMVQHLILTLIVPPLLLLGAPGWMLRPLFRNRYVFRLAKTLTSTAWCFLIFNIVLALWHLPPMYNMALANHPIHIFQHLMFIAAAVFMWWPLTSQLPELPRASYPAQLMYCFLLTIPMGVIAIYIAMAEDLLYPAYAIAPRILQMSPMSDQQYGGLIMWIPGALFFYIVMSVVFFKWYSSGKDDAASAQVGSVAQPL